MQKTIKAIALLGVFLLLSSVSFGQIQARWVKGKFTSVLKFEKQFLLKEITAPSETSGYGTLYVKSSDGDLYYKDDEGNEIIISHAAVTDAFTVKVDAGATAGYFGVAIGDGIFRVTENQFTMADGGNYVTLSLADHNTARTALGLAIGTDVVAWDGDLDTYAGITPSADVQSLLACATEAAMRTFLDLESGTDFPVVAHTMASHSDEDTYNISTSGSATIGSLIGPAAALDINTSVVQDVNIWDTIASGNPSINIYGWNTAGSDRESFELTMDDANDEALIQVPNSANNEGVTVSLQETNQKFRVRQNSDQIQFYHDGTDAYIHTTDGQIIMDTDEAAANAMLGLKDSDGSNEFYLSATAMAADVYWYLNQYSPVRTVVIKCVADDTAPTVTDGITHFTVPIELTGMDLVSVGAHVYTASADSGPVTVGIYNLTDTSEMLSTDITIDDTELDSSTAGTPAVVNAGEDDVVTGDVIRIDVSDIGSAATRGLEIRLGFKLPTS